MSQIISRKKNKNQNPHCFQSKALPPVSPYFTPLFFIVTLGLKKVSISTPVLEQLKTQNTLYIFSVLPFCLPSRNRNRLEHMQMLKSEI